MVFHFQSGNESGLHARIRQLLSESIEAHFSVAWITMGGFDMINPEEGENPRALETFLDDEGARLVITVGLSGRITSYDALEALLQLQQDSSGCLEIYVRHTEGGGRIFHPKTYLFINDEGLTTLIAGSNNLSRHGLGQSEEASIEINSENAPEAIESALTGMFYVIEVDDESSPSRRLNEELLEELLRSGLVLRENSPASRRNRRRQRSGIPNPGIFPPTSEHIPENLPEYGSGRPTVNNDGNDGDNGDDDDGVYIGVPWGSEEHPIPEYDGIRFAMVTTDTDIAGGYGAPAPEIRIPSHNRNQFEQRAIDNGLSNVHDFFVFPEESDFANGNDLTVFCFRMNNQEVIQLESRARIWHNQSGPGGGSGYRLNITDSTILRCSTQGGGDVIVIDSTQEGYVIRFVPQPFAAELIDNMNRENKAGKQYCFFNNGALVELPIDD